MIARLFVQDSSLARSAELKGSSFNFEWTIMPNVSSMLTLPKCVVAIITGYMQMVSSSFSML